MSIYRYGQVFSNLDGITAAAGTTFSSTFEIPKDSKGDNLSLLVNITAITGAGNTLTPSVQWSNDGSTWADTQGTADALTGLTATGAVVKSFPVKARYWRVKWVASGTVTTLTGTASAYVS